MRNLAEHKKNLQNEIARLLERLNSQSNLVKSAEPAALESIQGNLSELQNKIAALQYLLSIPEESEPVIIPFIPAGTDFVPSIPEIPKKEIPVTPPVKPAEPVIVPEIPVIKPVQEKTENIVTPPVKPAEPIVIPQEKPAEPVKIPVVEKTVTPPPATGKKAADIRSFIGFNEKIMFMRNLFKNDSAAYDEALNQINACGSFSEADAFLSVLQNEYSWDTKKEAVQIFIDTVKRRFA